LSHPIPEYESNRKPSLNGGKIQKIETLANNVILDNILMVQRILPGSGISTPSSTQSSLTGFSPVVLAVSSKFKGS